MLYSELHCKSNYSFLQAASHPEELVEQAQQLGYTALAITDRNSLAGVVRAFGAARELDLGLIIGAEITLQDAPPVVLWATDRAAYGRLCQLITVGRRRAEKGHCQLTFQDLAEHSEGLLAGVYPRWQGPTVPLTGDHDRIPASAPLVTAEQLHCYHELFQQRGWLLAPLHRGPNDEQQVGQLQQLSTHSRLPLLAAGDVHYHVAERMPLHDVLTAISHNRTVAQAGRQRFSNAQRHLRSLAELETIYRLIPQALERTQQVARQCRFSLDQLRYEYPEELAPPGLTAFQRLRQLTWQGAHKRYPQGIPARIQQLLEHELELIEQLRYEAYFLTVWDLVRFAREQNILCQGRGSAANSAVCFCLEITSVDPARSDLLFERFISRERDEAPDIDVDFEHQRREQVLQYIYDKYGRQRAGMTAVVITYRLRSAIRDVGKALGLSLDRVDALARQLDSSYHDELLEKRCRQVGLDPNSPLVQQLLEHVTQLVGFPRHLSQHVGGMVITQGELCSLVPIENAAMDGRTVIQWNKDDLDELGILKVDCLSLGMLTAIHKCFQMLKQEGLGEWTLATVPAEDPRVYEMICQADTIGVFQIESRAQMSMLPRLQPRCYYDLVIEVAIVRPGPIQGDMVHPYLRRRAGQEQPVYPTEEIRQVLHKTLGIPLFQEQAMRLAMVAADFTPGEADQLRRAMGAWRRPGLIDQFRHKLMEGMASKGLSRKFAELVFQQVRGFGEYGFPESHAASFALLVYVSAWLKYYHPAIYTAALINSQPMGFYSVSQLVQDARQHGVTVNGVDVNYSQRDCQLELDQQGKPTVLRLGLRLILSLPLVAQQSIMDARRDGPFSSQQDFQQRTGLSRSVIMRLAAADAFASFQLDRRTALWESLGQPSNAQSLPLFDSLTPDPSPPACLPALEEIEQVSADYQATGLSLRAHPISFCRPQLQQLGIVPASQLASLPDNQQVRVAGLVLLRQRPSTARGITFVTLEDETGIINLVIRQRTWERFYQVARRATAWIVRGTLESRQGVIHVVVDQLEPISCNL
jgi:error-prone DNA polymerase